MADNVEQSVSVVAVTAAVGAVVLLLVLLCSFVRKPENEKEEEDEKNPNTKENQNGHGKQQKKPAAKKQRSIERKERAAFSHPWLSCTLKSHSSPVLDLDFSTSGKFLASCAEDRTVMLWNVKDFQKRDHKQIRANVGLDHATKVRFSPDNKAFIVSLYNANSVRIFKIGKKDDGSPGNVQAAFDFPEVHTQEILNIGIASSGRFIMTCTHETDIKIWSLKGELLATQTNNQVKTSHGAVSPCGRFVASSGFTPDVKVWEVVFDKSGNFKEVSRAFELKGHSAGVYHFAFSGDSTRMATVSKDGTWKVWDTNIEYTKGQEPYLLHTGKFDGTQKAMVALSYDGRSVALAQGTTLHLYNAVTSEQEKTIENLFAGPITSLAFDVSNRYVVTSGDKHIHVFHNIIGYRATITDLEEKRRKASNSSVRERLQVQIDEARKMLQSVESVPQKNGNNHKNM